MPESHLRKHVPLLVVALLLLLVSGFIVVAGSRSSASPTRNPQSTTKPAGQQRVETYGKLPLTFEANRGQTDHRVKFLSQGSGYRLFLTSDEAVLAPQSSRKSKVESRKLTIQGKDAGALLGPRGFLSIDNLQSATDNSPAPTLQSPGAPAVLRMKLVGANPAAKVVGVEELPGKANYFIGNDPKKWRTDVPTYAKVKYEGVYPGIDLVYYGNQRQLEYDFVVAPGADPNAVQFAVAPDGAQQAAPLRIDANGDLVVQGEDGEVRFHKPVVYQPKVSLGSQLTIQNSELLNGRYVVAAGNRIHFEIPKYDKSRPLVIDPVLSYSTYLGGSGLVIGYGIAVDSSGSAYVTGLAESVDFPITNGLEGDTTRLGDVAFVTKFNAAGDGVVYSTYLSGGSASGIAVDSSGNAYVTGYTTSTDFPTMNPIQGTLRGNQNAFVSKLNASGNELLYSTYLGGSGVDEGPGALVDLDQGQGITVDSSGKAYVTGQTNSADFPTMNALQSTYGGGSVDAFVTKLNAAGTALVYSTYLGGSETDVAKGIAVDFSGNAYVTGYTNSSNFPTMNPFQAAFARGDDDVFVTKLNASGTALVYSTYLGGGGFDEAHGIAVDSSGSAYVTGGTDSGDFPTLNAFQSAPVGPKSAFVTKLNPAGNGLVYSTYLGGSFNTGGSRIAIDLWGNAYVAGGTSSTDFPTVNPIQATFGGGFTDAFVSELNPEGNALVYSTYLGGNGNEGGFGIAVDSSGNAYVTGYTQSSHFPTMNAFQPTLGGADAMNAFVTKIASTVPFSSFSTKLAITAGPRPGFQMYASFTLGAGGSINPLTQPVTLQVGNYSVTIPSGSFKQLGQGSKAGSYVYSGTMNGVSLQVHIVALGNSGYVFKAAAQPVDLTALSNPLSVTITIGNNSGTAEAAAKFERKS